MTTGERIKQSRIRLHMTADQLAEKVGVNRATIYRYENGGIENMSIDVLKPLADALNTTPAALMGWTDDDAASSLSSIEAALLSNFRCLNHEGQGKVLDYVTDLAASGRYIKNNQPGMVEEYA